MQIAQALVDSEVLNADGGFAYQLRQGHSYLLYDQECGLGLRQNALRIITDRRLPKYYTGQELASGRALFPFIGKCGDAITAMRSVCDLIYHYPNISIDICATPSTMDVFTLFDWPGELLPYPIEADAINAYAYLLTLEDIEAVKNGTVKSTRQVFGKLLNIPASNAHPVLSIPPDVLECNSLPPTDRQLIGVHCGRAESLRTYPHDLLKVLVAELIQNGFHAVLFGADDPPAEIIGHPQVTNRCRHTETASDLAAIFAQLHAAIVCDSFPMHLGGVMDIPTLAMFTATDAVLGSDYPSVKTIQSEAVCSPCRIAEGRCPEKHDTCIAHHDPSLSPSVILSDLQDMLAGVRLPCAADPEQTRSWPCSL